MTSFKGFSEAKQRLTPIPAQFFSELLPEIDHLGELKISLYAIWKLDRMEGEMRCLQFDDFASDEKLMAGLAVEAEQAQNKLSEALDRAVKRGLLLRLEVKTSGQAQAWFFLNSARGRRAFTQAQNGRWTPETGAFPTPGLADERPNIFRLYEENIGPLTPLVAEILRDAETAYSAEWLEEAVRAAVENNARNWRYVEAILRSWKEKGRDEQDRRNAKKDRRRYDEGEFADFIER